MKNTGERDKNKKEVYEGDIVEIITVIGKDFSQDPSYFTNLYEVIFENGKFTFGGYTFDNGFVDAIEIVGNIFKNPKLLKRE